MNMVSVEIKKVDIESFKNICNLGGFPGLSFLQTYNWADIQEGYGNNCSFFIFESSDNIIGFTVAIKITAFKFFKYYYLPRGPFFKNGLSQDIKNDIVMEMAKKFDADFLRIEPVSFDFEGGKRFCKTRDIQPAKTSFLNLKDDLELIFGKMKSKTRYNIRLAEKKGVKILESTDKDLAFNNFIKLIKVTSKRDSFSIHKDDYYGNLINYNNGFIRVFEAYYNGEVLASGIFSFSGDCVSYLHGASDNKYRNVMAPYLLHSKVIKIAKEEGFSFYDFYGVDNLKWPGVSRFKQGFGGEELAYPGTYDFKINIFKYFVYSFLRKLNSFKSKFL